MRITTNFYLSEFVKSSTASRLGIDNTPPDSAVGNITDLVESVLQPIRTGINTAIIINSGYRCKELNTAIGGSKNSQHMVGQAVDFEALEISNLDLFNYITSSGVEFDQLILEYHDPKNPYSGWVHLSYNKDNNRNQVFEIK